MLEQEFELKWDVGVRTACVIMDVGKPFASKIQVPHEYHTFDFKDMMSILLLRGIPPELKLGARFRLRVDGPDEEEAMRAMAELFTAGARMDHCPKPGCKSPPILIGYTPSTLTYICCGGPWDVARPKKEEEHA